MRTENFKENKSLSEVHNSVDTTSGKTAWKKILSFFGPAYLVSVGYMDPGNWATDIAGGSQYGYTLIWVLIMSNLMALLLQGFSSRLGLVSGRDLAQASRESYSPFINIFLYGLAEIAIAACDLAEVLGMAIGLKLLFGLPILYGVAITVFDTILLLFLQKLGMRKIEMFIISLVAVIGLSFFIELIFAKPDGIGIIKGIIPTIPDGAALYIIIGIIGATVMPHNLYLHSALVQTRKIEKGRDSLKKALKFNMYDSAIALNIALFVNAAILILAASVFHTRGYKSVADITDAYKLLQPLLGRAMAPTLFAIALIASGQSSTITGTLAGQIVMEGHLKLRIPIWIRRLITRMLAVIPAFFVVLIAGEGATGKLLILSQVVLSLQLGFAVIPLIHFVSDKVRMGEFAIGKKAKIAGWLIAALIVAFNVKMILETLQIWLTDPSLAIWLKGFILVTAIFLACLLLFITFQPLVKGLKAFHSSAPHGTARLLGDIEGAIYKRIAITVDFSDTDNKAIQHAIAQGGHAAEYVLIHVLETPNAILSEESADMESGLDILSLNEYVTSLASKGYIAHYELGYGRRTQAIPHIVNNFNADLLVMGSHGHDWLSDLLFGQTIDTVRHRIKVPLLAVK
jgi:manganese transport protein